MKTGQLKREPSSFRDPSGFVFYSGNSVFRQINDTYKETYFHFKRSGLVNRLIDEKLLIPFTEVPSEKKTTGGDSFVKLKTDKIPFVSYPFEWCFEQLKDAALCTLHIQKLSLEYEMTLKDASAYNIQFLHGKPIFIDLLSFEKYAEGKPWVAYQQFCRHFLGPLVLMAKIDFRLILLLERFLDGIPLDFVSKLLPKSSYLNLSTLTHIHLHARNQKKYGFSTSRGLKKSRLTKTMQIGIIDNLEGFIAKLKYNVQDSQWGQYSDLMNYSGSAFAAKKKIVESFLFKKKPKSVWDLGANTGEFSRIAGNKNIFTVSLDNDFEAVQSNYLKVKNGGEKYVLPIFCDLTNPTPNFGWENMERKSLIARGPCDLALALALIHHLCITNNLTFAMVASFFSNIANNLIIEFIPNTDDKVKFLLKNRENIFNWYNQENFEMEFSKYFGIENCKQVGNKSQRALYLMHRK